MTFNICPAVNDPISACFCLENQNLPFSEAKGSAVTPLSPRLPGGGGHQLGTPTSWGPMAYPAQPLLLFLLHL